MSKELFYTVKPRINGVNLAICSLPDGVVRQGTLIVQGAEKEFYEGLLRIMNQRVLIRIQPQEGNLSTWEFGKSNPGRSRVRIFTFLKSRRENSCMVTAIMKHCTDWKNEVDFETPGLFTCLRNWNYFRYYFSIVPTVLLELTGVQPAEKELFNFYLERALMEYYGLNLLAERVELFRGKLYQPIGQTCQADEEEDRKLQNERESLETNPIVHQDPVEKERLTNSPPDDAKAVVQGSDKEVSDQSNEADNTVGKRPLKKTGDQGAGYRKRSKIKRQKAHGALSLPPDGPLFQFAPTIPARNNSYPLPPYSANEQGGNHSSHAGLYLMDPRHEGMDKYGQKKGISTGMRYVPVNRESVNLPPNLP